MIYFRNIINRWEQWAQTANKSEDGWESDFPEWSLLISSAKELMLKDNLNNEDIINIEKVWALSTEDEDMQDFAKENINLVFPLLKKLVKSKSEHVRWQIYNTIPLYGKEGEEILRKGLNDLDMYCKRMALINLAILKPSDAKEIALKFINADDPYLRQASIDMVLATDNADYIRRARDILIHDKVEHVRKAAIEEFKLYKKTVAAQKKMEFNRI